MSYTSLLTLSLAESMGDKKCSFTKVEKYILEFSKSYADQLEKENLENADLIKFGKWKNSRVSKLMGIQAGQSYLRWFVKQEFCNKHQKKLITKLLKEHDEAPDEPSSEDDVE